MFRQHPGVGWLLDFGKRRIVGMIVSWVVGLIVLNLLLGSATRDGRPLTDQEKGNINVIALIVGFLLSLAVTHRMKREQKARREAKRLRRAFLRFARRPAPPRRFPPLPPPPGVYRPPPMAQRRWPYGFQRRKP
jgi:hypothetical protein